MIVVDASVLATALTDDGADGDLTRARLRSQALAARELIDLEVTSVLRRRILNGHLPAQRAEQALADLVALPMQRVQHLPLLARCWSLRNNLSIYDASYVALAESLSSVLLTADARLSRSTGLRFVVEVLQRPDPSA